MTRQTNLNKRLRNLNLSIDKTHVLTLVDHYIFNYCSTCKRQSCLKFDIIIPSQAVEIYGIFYYVFCVITFTFMKFWLFSINGC